MAKDPEEIKPTEKPGSDQKDSKPPAARPKPATRKYDGPNPHIMFLAAIVGLFIGLILRDNLEPESEENRFSGGVIIESLVTKTPSTTNTPLLPTASPTATATPVVTREESLEQEMIELVNYQRELIDLKPLKVDPVLAKIALFRSEDMANFGYFSHEPPGGCGFACALMYTGYIYSIAGENIAWNNYPRAETLETAMDGLMKSQSHRDNILSCHYEKIGVAVAKIGNKYYYTQIFDGYTYC